MHATYTTAFVLAAVLLLIAGRNAGRFAVPIWQILLAGAAVVLATGEISPVRALGAINADVMVFLFCMFVIGEAVSESGLLDRMLQRIACHAHSGDGLLLLFISGTGVLSALLMNDTLAIIGTPFAIRLARATGIAPRLLLLALAFSVTTGSVASPVGNPQNLLIALSGGIDNPFFVFLWYFGLPTCAGLLLVYFVLRTCYPDALSRADIRISCGGTATDPALAGAARLSIALLVVLIAARAAWSGMTGGELIPLPAIAALSAVPVLLYARDRGRLVRSIDWGTLVFFAALFVLMQSVADSGLLDGMLACCTGPAASPAAIFVAAVAGSQLISNVPFVALFLPAFTAEAVSLPALMALAAGSTIAGNLLLFGAASNVIIIQQAERNGETIGFYEFATAGIPLTLLQGMLYFIVVLAMPLPPF
ncbi:MAG: anion transporter [Methanomicrobiales archaeon]|nr:anion transporter [Methanomicrobiales archaeon]